MERLSKVAPAKKLNADQKARLADLESLYRSKIAQAELAAQDEVTAADAAGDAEKAETCRAGFLAEKRRLESELEAKREKIRSEA